jgi:glycine/serine hydroxymethyltransferase
MLYEPLSVCDPEIANLIELERERQFDGLELIASEVIKCELKSISIFLIELYFCCGHGSKRFNSH